MSTITAQKYRPKMAATYFALSIKFKAFFLANLYWKTLETELKRF